MNVLYNIHACICCIHTLIVHLYIVGDNGQGDVRAAEMALDSYNYKKNIHRVYIHEIKPIHQTYTKHILTKKVYNIPNICYFKTYIDAAIDAYNHNLIRINGLVRIMTEAIFDFEYITPDEWKKCELLGPSFYTTNNIAPTNTITNTNSSSNNSSSNSIITRQRSKTRSSITTTKQTYNAQRLYHYQLLNEYKYDINIRDLNNSLTKANIILIKRGLQPVKLIKYKARFYKGHVVQTPYGKGIVLKFRPNDGIYEVTYKGPCLRPSKEATTLTPRSNQLW